MGLLPEITSPEFVAILPVTVIKPGNEKVEPEKVIAELPEMISPVVLIVPVATTLPLASSLVYAPVIFAQVASTHLVNLFTPFWAE
jgi:hypothetical protein